MSVSSKERLFRLAKGGDGGALTELLEGERANLYDFLMRLTGQVSRSAETVDEVYVSLSGGGLDAFASWIDLQLCLYTTARKFNADIWNADTSRLANAALNPDGQAGSPAAARQAERQARSQSRGGLAAAQTLDRLFRLLPGPEREALWLKFRLELPHELIARIMARDVGEVAALHTSGWGRLQAEGRLGEEVRPVLLAGLIPHPLPTRPSVATIDLSMVMQGIKTRPQGVWSPLRITLVLLLGAALAGAVVFRSQVEKSFDHWREELGRRGWLG